MGLKEKGEGFAGCFILEKKLLVPHRQVEVQEAVPFSIKHHGDSRLVCQQKELVKSFDDYYCYAFGSNK